MAVGFYFDAESCIGCRTCQVACKDAHDLPIGTNYRIVRSFCTGSGETPRLYHLSLALQGCDFCAEWCAQGEDRACVAACPMRALEFGDVDELRARHKGEILADSAAPLAVEGGAIGPALVMRVKDCMDDADYDEIIV